METLDTASTASQINLMAMAKHGDLNALAALMNRSLRTKGIFTELSLAGNCLTVIAMFSQAAPHKPSLVEMLKRGLNNMQPKGVKRVMVRAVSIEDESLAWQSAFLVLPINAANNPARSSLNSIAEKIPGLPQMKPQTEASEDPMLPMVKPKASTKSMTSQALWGYALICIGIVMMLTGLGQDITPTAGEGDGSYSPGALANKAIHAQAGGAMMISGAILITGKRS